MSAPLPLPLASARELYAKLQRDAALLEGEVTTDRFYNFVITGYSIIDWVKADPDFASVDPQTIYQSPWLKSCGDLANASKHFTLTRRQPITKSASLVQGFGAGRYGRGGYGAGKESIQIELNDGTTIDCLPFVSAVMEFLQSLF